MKPVLFPLFLLLGFLSLIPINANAGMCSISGSGIGGTGAPALPSNSSGIGGTGSPLSKTNGSGIGGTGAIASRSGIGGTGQKTDKQTTIIIGTITGFGSICVNGVEIHYLASTPVQVNGEASNVGQLALGQVVSVNVAGTGNEVYAQDINVINIVAGPVTNINSQLQQVTILGQKVYLSDKTYFPQGTTKLADIQKGSFIQVSGLRQADGAIVASRIDHSNSTNTAQITGIAQHITTKGFTIQGVSVATPNQPSIKEGQEVTVRGLLEAEKIIAKQITTSSITEGQKFKIESLVNFNKQQDHIKFGQIEIPVSDQLKNTLSSLPKNQSVIFSGSMDNEHEVKIEHIFIKDFINKYEPEHNQQPQFKLDEQKNEKDDSQAEKTEFKILESQHKNHSHEVTQTETPEFSDSSDIAESDTTDEIPDVNGITDNNLPEAPEIEVPPEFEPPEAPEIEAPPEFEPPEAPEIEAPPEFEPPEVPEIEAPPEFEPPEVPEIEAPPEFEP
ncbi:MAG: DUF5666 domain-containing protein, partial [Methylococcales bacterium]